MRKQCGTGGVEVNVAINHVYFIILSDNGPKNESMKSAFPSLPGYAYCTF